MSCATGPRCNIITGTNLAISHIDIKHQTFKLEISKDDIMKVHDPDFGYVASAL